MNWWAFLKNKIGEKHVEDVKGNACWFWFMRIFIKQNIKNNERKILNGEKNQRNNVIEINKAYEICNFFVGSCWKNSGSKKRRKRNLNNWKISSFREVVIIEWNLWIMSERKLWDLGINKEDWVDFIGREIERKYWKFWWSFFFTEIFKEKKISKKFVSSWVLWKRRFGKEMRISKARELLLQWKWFVN